MQLSQVYWWTTSNRHLRQFAATSTSTKRIITFLFRLYFVIWGIYWRVYCFIECSVAKTLLDTISLDRVNLAAPIQHKSNKTLDRPSILASGNSFKPTYNSLGNHKINTVTEAVGLRGLVDSHRPAPSRVLELKREHAYETAQVS